MALIEMIFDRIDSMLAESRTYRLRKRECVSCNNYKLQIENERRERAKLIELLQARTSPAEIAQEIIDAPINYQPVPRAKSWIQRRYELEQTERQKVREQVVEQ